MLRLFGGMACLGALPVAEGAVAILGSPVVDFTLVAVCIAAIVAFTILFEIGLERLEHKLEVRACVSCAACQIDGRRLPMPFATNGLTAVPALRGDAPARHQGSNDPRPHFVLALHARAV